MSASATKWAWQQAQVSSIAKFLLVTLGLAADEDGENAYRSAVSLARSTNSSKATVHRALNELLEAVLIERIERKAPNGAFLASEYRLKIRETPLSNRDSPPYQNETPLSQNEPTPLSQNETSSSSKRVVREEPTLRVVKKPVGQTALFAEEQPEVVPKSSTQTKRKMPRQLTEDWAPDPVSRQFAIDTCVDPDKAAEEFRNYWIGEGKPKADWQRTFRNRVMVLREQGRFPIARSKRDDTRRFPDGTELSEAMV